MRIVWGCHSINSKSDNEALGSAPIECLHTRGCIVCAVWTTGGFHSFMTMHWLSCCFVWGSNSHDDLWFHIHDSFLSCAWTLLLPVLPGGWCWKMIMTHVRQQFWSQLIMLHRVKWFTTVHHGLSCGGSDGEWVLTAVRLINTIDVRNKLFPSVIVDTAWNCIYWTKHARASPDRGNEYLQYWWGCIVLSQKCEEVIAWHTG